MFVLEYPIDFILTSKSSCVWDSTFEKIFNCRSCWAGLTATYSLFDLVPQVRQTLTSGVWYIKDSVHVQHGETGTLVSCCQSHYASQTKGSIVKTKVFKFLFWSHSSTDLMNLGLRGLVPLIWFGGCWSVSSHHNPMPATLVHQYSTSTIWHFCVKSETL